MYLFSVSLCECLCVHPVAVCESVVCYNSRILQMKLNGVFAKAVDLLLKTLAATSQLFV